MNDDLAAPDEIIGVVPLSPAAREGIEGLFRVRTPDFRAMALVAGLDPASDFRGKDLRGIDFRGSDLSGFDFSGADLRGCDFSHARIETTRFDGARRMAGDNRWISLQHAGSTDCAAFSADGRFIVTGSGSADCTARVWDTASGAELRRLEGHEGWVKSAAFSADGLFIVTASDDNTARVWDAVSGAELRRLEGHKGSVFSAAFSADGRFIVTGSHDTTARIWFLDDHLEPAVAP